MELHFCNHSCSVKSIYKSFKYIKNLELLNTSILQNVATCSGISEISFYPENKQSREWSGGSRVFISTLLISVRGRRAAQTNPGPSPSRMRTLSSALCSSECFGKGVPAVFSHPALRVTTNRCTQRAPRAFNEVTQSGAGRNPWGAAALLRTPKVFCQ